MTDRPLGELGQAITEMWAWVCFDGQGEGLPAFEAYNGGQRTCMPMCGADRARVESMRDIAQNVANSTGKSVELRRFTRMETIDAVNPKKP